MCAQFSNNDGIVRKISAVLLPWGKVVYVTCLDCCSLLDAFCLFFFFFLPLLRFLHVSAVSLVSTVSLVAVWLKQWKSGSQPAFAPSSPLRRGCPRVHDRPPWYSWYTGGFVVQLLSPSNDTSHTYGQNMNFASSFILKTHFIVILVVCPADPWNRPWYCITFTMSVVLFAFLFY